MKKLVFFTAMLLCITCLSSAQEDTIPRMYRAWIIQYGNTPNIKGLLYEIKDSAISIANSYSRVDYLSGNFKVRTINYNNIFNIKTRRNNKILIGFLIGASAGIATGAIIGASQGDDPPCEYFCIFHMTAGEKALLGGSLGAISGTIIGALIGAFRISIPINGNIRTFNENKERLKKYSYKH